MPPTGSRSASFWVCLWKPEMTLLFKSDSKFNSKLSLTINGFALTLVAIGEDGDLWFNEEWSFFLDYCLKDVKYTACSAPPTNVRRGPPLHFCDKKKSTFTIPWRNILFREPKSTLRISLPLLKQINRQYGERGEGTLVCISYGQTKWASGMGI